MNNDRIRQIIGGAACLLLAGCASTSTTGTSSATNLPPATVNIHESPVPIGDQATAYVPEVVTLQANQTAIAQTLAGTPTITPTPRPMANLPDVPLSQKGPWLIFLASTDERGPRYLWAINPDGSGLTQLIDKPVITFDARPVESVENGVTIAFVTEPQSDEETEDSVLKTIILPGREVETISALIDATNITDTLSPSLVATAVREGGLSWSPDGRQLAFVSGLDGPSVDVYTYDILSKAITRLTDGPDHAYALSWSPDGRYVVHQGSDFTGMGGPYPLGMWAARADGSGAVSLVKENEFGVYMSYSWLNSTEILATNHCFDACESDVRRINIETGDTQIILKEQFTDIAYAPEHDAWMLSRSAPSGFDTVLVLIRNGERIEIPGQGISQVWWSASQDVFTGDTPGGESYTIALSGKITRVSSPTPWRPEDRSGYPLYTYLSPDKTLQAWHFYEFYNSFAELWVGEPMGEPKLIFSDNDLLARDVTWSPDSQRLLILTDQGLWMAECPDFKPLLITERLYADDWSGWEGEWIP